MSYSNIDNVKSPKNQLDWLRVLMLPALLNSLALFPALLITAIMASDSGTPGAIRGSYLAILFVLFYAGALFVAMLAWDKWAMISAILISLFALSNIAAVIVIESAAPLLAIAPWHQLGLANDSIFRTILEIVLGVSFGIMVPILSAWRLFRYAFELDVVDYSTPVELWDLKRLNK